MRRGTPSALLFGQCMIIIREEYCRESQRAIGRRIDVPSATISQIEKGYRALKEKWIPRHAKALEVSQNDLKELWWATQGYVRNSGQHLVLSSRHDDQREYIRHCLFRLSPTDETLRRFDLLEFSLLKPEGAIIRHRGKAPTKSDLEQKLIDLTSVEKAKVFGYIDRLLEDRDE